jgi:HAMP domain-containing protein
MADSAAAIVKGASAMKADLVSDQQRLESESDTTIVETERLIVVLAAGGFLLGAVLALLLGKQISRPMTAMCKAMRELANGNFDVVLPGLGRRDELGEMAGAVEEFKMQAIAKAERDAAAQDAQNRASSAARRAEPSRFSDDFEAAVGAIVSNVSASAVQLEQAAGTLTRTAETTQSLSSQVAGASEEASSNMQSVAAATEELSTSVDEIGRRVRESNQIAEAAVLQAQRQIVAFRARDRRRGQTYHGDRRTDQSLGAECNHRSRPRRRSRPRFCSGRLRGQIAGEPDREGDRRDILAHFRHARRDAGIGRSHQGDRRHDRPDLKHRLDDRERGGEAKLGNPGNRAQRSERCPGNP